MEDVYLGPDFAVPTNFLAQHNNTIIPRKDNVKISLGGLCSGRLDSIVLVQLWSVAIWDKRVLELLWKVDNKNTDENIPIDKKVNGKSMFWHRKAGLIEMIGG